MRSLKYIVTPASVLVSVSLLTACAGPPKCESDGRYMQSREGKRIQAPDDLDDLASYKEMTIPQASPRSPQQDTESCLEAPPAVSSGGRS